MPEWVAYSSEIGADHRCDGVLLFIVVSPCNGVSETCLI